MKDVVFTNIDILSGVNLIYDFSVVSHTGPIHMSLSKTMT